MADIDQALQKYLDDLDRGVPLETLLSSLPASDKELGPLLQMAAAVRTVPHPIPLREDVAPGHYRIMQAARELKTRQASRLTLTGFFDHFFRNLQPARAIALAGIALAVIVVLASVGIWSYGPRAARFAQIMDVHGTVQLASGEGVEQLSEASNGMAIKEGQALSTGPDSTAILVFYDGTRTTLSPNTQVLFNELRGRWGGGLAVVVSQQTGRTSHQVIPFRSDSSKFIVNTPSGSASVHGTSFAVSVDSPAVSRFLVENGEVLVENAGNQVPVRAGESTASISSKAPEEPSYGFSIRGVVTAIQKDTWVISGVIIKTQHNTTLTGDPQVGGWVQAEGRIWGGDAWLADKIETIEPGEPVSNFTGIVEEIGATEWLVGGVQVFVNENSIIAEDIAVGDLVRVTFSLSATGNRLALSIDALESQKDPAAKPVLAFEPERLALTGCQQEFSAAATVKNMASDPVNYASDVRLGAMVVEGSAWVDEVTISPSSWHRLDAGQAEEFTLQFKLNRAWETQPAGSEIQVKVFIAHETNRPNQYRKVSLLVDIVSTCEAQNTATPTATATETPVITLTQTATPTPTVTPTPNPELIEDPCTGADPQPKGMKLAELYGVPYEEIMGWFCQGYGFGEIDLAYGLSRTHALPVEDIFGMRASGLGWGEIKQQLGEIGKEKQIQKTPPGQSGDKNPKKP